jgi:hypothetical protein
MIDIIISPTSSSNKIFQTLKQFRYVFVARVFLYWSVFSKIETDWKLRSWTQMGRFVYVVYVAKAQEVSTETVLNSEFKEFVRVEAAAFVF